MSYNVIKPFCLHYGWEVSTTNLPNIRVGTCSNPCNRGTYGLKPNLA